MQDFRTRIDFVKAIRWKSAGDLDAIPDDIITFAPDGSVFITTPEGKREVKAGDWIVRDFTGAYFSMSDDVFQRKYVAAEQSILPLVSETA